jgi:hypothetical protein
VHSYARALAECRLSGRSGRGRQANPLNSVENDRILSTRMMPFVRFRGVPQEIKTIGRLLNAWVNKASAQTSYII